MSNFHKNFPFGKGIWIWQLKNCLNGNIPAIIQKMKDKDLQYAIVKAGDGPNTWDFQWTKELVDSFHAAGLKIYSWSYVYGLEPVREGQIASWALNLGGDGHVFDAESEFEHLPDPISAAEQLLQAVRTLNPNSFLAHAPYPIIDYHKAFPYAVFGKYCDVVMPQVYQGDFKLKSVDAINWMYEQWSKWEATVAEESRKPIIPIGQTYDNYEMKPPYVLSPADITEFVGAAAGYKSVNFYEFAHILREECWEAIRTAKVTPPTDADLGRSGGGNSTESQSSAPVSTPPTPPAPTAPAAGNSPENPVSSQPATPDSTTVTPTIPASDEANTDKLAPGTQVLDQQTLPVPSTIKVTKNPQSPGGVQLKVVPHKPHIDYVIEFFTWLFSQVTFWKKKGGDAQ